MVPFSLPFSSKSIHFTLFQQKVGWNCGSLEDIIENQVDLKKGNLSKENGARMHLLFVNKFCYKLPNFQLSEKNLIILALRHVLRQLLCLETNTRYLLEIIAKHYHTINMMLPLRHCLTFSASLAKPLPYLRRFFGTTQSNLAPIQVINYFQIHR